MLHGRIVETTYLGDVIQYRVETKGGVELQVSEMNPHVVRDPGETEIGIDVAAEDVVVMKD